jgi:hypothetical protein
MEAAKEQDYGTHATSWLASSLAGLCVTMFVANFPLFALARSSRITGGWGADLSVGNHLGGVLFLLVGALIAARRPRNPIGWILLAEDGLLWM